MFTIHCYGELSDLQALKILRQFRNFGHYSTRFYPIIKEKMDTDLILLTGVQTKQGPIGRDFFEVLKMYGTELFLVFSISDDR